jgi:prepilin-type N-terminal cleavage/methylation domain-containing protein
MSYNKDNMYKKGFTLIELIVVIGILSIIALSISQPVANIIKYQRESQTSDNMRDNLQFVINKMEKELKTASNVSTITNEISFKDQFNADVKYTYETYEIKRNGFNLTDNGIFKVTAVNFIINPTTKLVTINIQAQSLDEKDSVIMQTSVYPLNN